MATHASILSWRSPWTAEPGGLQSMEVGGGVESHKVQTQLKRLSTAQSEVARPCPTLCDPMDSSLPGFSVHGIFQAGTLVWFAISFSRRSSRPRDRTQASRTAGRRFTL